MTTFASLNDLAILLGYLSEDDLTAAQAVQGTLLLEMVSGAVAGGLGQTPEWAAALDPVPDVVRSVVLTTVLAFMQNPGGARSESETLGAYSHATSYTDSAHGFSLSDDLLKLCRWAIFGRRSGTFMPKTTVDLVIELGETGEIAEFPAT